MSDATRVPQWLRTMNVPAGGEAVEHYELKAHAMLIDVRFGAELEALDDLELQITVAGRDLFATPIALPLLERSRGKLLERLQLGERMTVRLLNRGRSNIEARPFVIYNVASRDTLAFPEVT